MKIYSAKKSSDTKKIICLCCKLVIEQPMNSRQKVKQSKELSRLDFLSGELVHLESEQLVYQISHFLFDKFDHLQWHLQLSLSAGVEGYLHDFAYLKPAWYRQITSDQRRPKVTGIAQKSTIDTAKTKKKEFNPNWLEL